MTTPSGPRLRASDAEREQIATILRAAMTEGRLNLDEGEQRLTAAYKATYRDELGPLTADLPDGGRGALVRTPEAEAQAKAEMRLFLRRRAGVLAAVGVLFAALFIANGALFFPVFPLIVLLFFLHWASWGRRAYSSRYRDWYTRGDVQGRGDWRGRRDWYGHGRYGH
ncbi:DUF1707 domain-containing protein [Asanoa sp. NPDC049573]|uniref:DUF1707 SHOCT-like domain-containing protein n=1 Tax=Asanoa sp. NPDC049573 TaxID=3155396 RepID=UPI003446FA0D